MAAKCTLASRVDSFHESSDGKVTSRDPPVSSFRHKQTAVTDLSLFTGWL